MVEIAPINSFKNLAITNPIILDAQNYVKLSNFNLKQINLSCMELVMLLIILKLSNYH